MIAMNRARHSLLLLCLLVFQPHVLHARPATYRLWQKVEITMHARNARDDPYKDV